MAQNTQARLVFLGRVVEKEIKQLQSTAGKLFSTPFSLEKTLQLDKDDALSEQLDAFVSRFSRLQDTLGNKLLPALLSALGEQTGPVIENLDKAEKFTWVVSVDDWLNIRMLRNQMVHEYIEDPAILHNAINTAHDFVDTLVTTARKMLQAIPKR